MNRMNRTLAITLSCLALLATGCKEKKQTDDIIVSKVEEVSKPQAPVRMQNSSDTKQVPWLGKTYTVELNRVPDDSLRMVKNESGQQFVDNRITLRIIRADGSVFFHRVFFKNSFDAQLDEVFRKNGILEGLVFDKVQGNVMEFAGSVCLPQTDEYIPLLVKVDNFGHVTIVRDENLDTTGDTTPQSQPSTTDDYSEDGV